MVRIPGYSVDCLAPLNSVEFPQISVPSSKHRKELAVCLGRPGVEAQNFSENAGKVPGGFVISKQTLR